MRPLRTIHLIFAVMAITVLAEFFVMLGPVIPFQASRIVGHLFVLFNLAVALAGWWTAHRTAWLVYLVASVAGFVLIGAATPVNALLLLRALFWD